MFVYFCGATAKRHFSLPPILMLKTGSKEKCFFQAVFKHQPKSASAASSGNTLTNFLARG